MSDLFAKKPRAHWLKGMKIREVSLVDAPANEGSDIIFMKSHDGEPSWEPITKDVTAVYARVDGAPALLGYETVQPNGTVTFQKAGEADGSQPDEEQLEGDETAQDEDRPVEDVKRAKKVRKMRKAIRKALKRLALAKADRDFSSGQDGNGYHSESDRVGAQDARSDQEHVDDTSAILREILRSPPVASESWTRYSVRVFGVAALGEMTSDEIEAAKAAYLVCLKHAGLKAWAAQSLDAMAKSMSAETGKPFESCFLKAAQTDVGRKLYSLSKDTMRSSYGAPQIGGDGVIDNARAERTLAASGSRRNVNQIADAGSMSPNECLQKINDEADRIRQEMGTTHSNARLIAGQRFPAHYEKSRQAR